MCEPVSIAAGISAATALAGTAMQVQGARQADKAQGQVISAEAARQRGFEGEARNALAGALQQTTPEAAEAARIGATADRTADYAAATAPTAAQAGYLPGQAGGPQIVRDEVDRQRGIAQLFTGQQAGARAALGGWADSLYGVRDAIGRSGEAIGTAGSLARGSASTLPAMMTAARSAGDGTRLAGDLTIAGGQIAGGAAGGSGWGSIFGGTPRPNVPKNKPAAAV